MASQSLQMTFDFIGTDSRPQAVPPDRLFFALKPNCADIERVWSEAGNAIGSLAIGTRRISPACLHMSLVSIGDHDGLSPHLLNEIRAATAGMEMPSIDIVLDRLCRFGGNAIVLRCSAPLDEVKILRRTLLRALSHLRVVRQCNKPQFEPHLTVLYSKVTFAERSIKPVRWRADRVHLVHSLRGRAMHRTIASLPKAIASRMD